MARARPARRTRASRLCRECGRLMRARAGDDYRRGRLPGIGLLLTTAPLLWWALFSLTIGYDPLQGRFFVFPVALSASVWGAALRVPPVAWAVVAVAAGTTLCAGWVRFPA